MFSKRFGIHAVLIIACLAIIVLPRIREKPQTEKAAAAALAVTHFLDLVDADQYQGSYDAAAELLKQKVTQEQWIEQLSEVRAVSGAFVGRTQKDITYSSSAKDSPDGEYITLFFDSSFQKRQQATETVTVVLETDQKWRVAGYFIQ